MVYNVWMELTHKGIGPQKAYILSVYLQNVITKPGKMVVEEDAVSNRIKYEDDTFEVNITVNKGENGEFKGSIKRKDEKYYCSFNGIDFGVRYVNKEETPGIYEINGRVLSLKSKTFDITARYYDGEVLSFIDNITDKKAFLGKYFVSTVAGNLDEDWYKLASSIKSPLQNNGIMPDYEKIVSETDEYGFPASGKEVMSTIQSIQAKSEENKHSM